MHDVFPYQGKLFPRFSARQWWLLIAAALVIGVVSLGAHDLAISVLGVPYPDQSDVPGWAKFASLAVRLAALVYFCHLSSWYLNRKTGLAAALLMGGLLVFSHEILRLIVIVTVLVEGWVAQRWVYVVLQNLPEACVYLYCGAVAIVIARRLPRSSLPVIAAAVLIGAALGYYVIKPAAAGVGDWIVHSMNLTEPAELYQPPYSLYIDSFVYGMFIEPTIAMFAFTWLAWPGLQGSPARRIAVLTMVTLLMRGRVIGTFLFSFWIKLPLATAIAAEGQFFVETLLLAALTGLAWNFATRSRVLGSHHS